MMKLCNEFRLLACISLTLALSCSQFGVISPVQSRIAVSVAVIADTKAEGQKELSESSIRNVQLFVFNEAGSIVFNKVIQSGFDDMEIEIAPGKYDIHAFVNCPAISSVTSLNELYAVATQLSYNSLSSFQMTGNTGLVKVLDGTMLRIDVRRLVSKVIVEKLSVDWSSAPYMASDGFTVTGIYLTNVRASDDYGFNKADQEVQWLNKMKYQDNEASHLISECGMRITSFPHESIYCFYPYPNRCTADSQGPPWSPRRSRLVIEAESDKRGAMFYPIDLPVLERNETVRFREIIITRYGSDNPDVPVSTDALKIEFEIEQWLEGEDYEEFF